MFIKISEQLFSINSIEYASKNILKIQFVKTPPEELDFSYFDVIRDNQVIGSYSGYNTIYKVEETDIYISNDDSVDLKAIANTVTELDNSQTEIQLAICDLYEQMLGE